MKKNLIIIILLTIISLEVPAQKVKDALYLKNGSIIYGRLMEINTDLYKIQTNDGSLFIFPVSEVEKFVKEVPDVSSRKEEGLGLSLEAGLLVGSQNTDYKAPFSFNILASYTLGTKNIFSIGSGVEFLGVSYTPLYGEYKFLVNSKRATPFFFVRAGGLFHLGAEKEGNDQYNQYNKKDFRGGPSFTAGTGISWAKEDIEPFLSFAYRYTTTGYTQTNYNNVDYEYETNYNRLEIKFGFRF